MTTLICSLFFLHLIASVMGQACQGEIGFSKTVNTAVMLPTKVLLDGSDKQPVSKDCLLLCLQSSDCFGFNLNYTAQSCEAISVSDGGNFNTDLYMSTPKTSFFRKICNIAVSNPKCNDIPWVIEQVLSSFMDKSSSDETHDAVSSDDCANSCLSSQVCRSATFDKEKETCILHRQDRRTRPTAFHNKANETRQYLENQCADMKSSNCHYKISNNTAVITKDAIANALTQMECEHKCDQDERDLCRSYSYDSTSHLCYLSGDDAISLGVNATQSKESVYGERKCVPENCSNGNGPSAFERVTGRILQTVTTPEGPQPMDLNSDLTISCLKECEERGASCVAVIMDYTNFLCQFATERSTGSTYSDFSIAVGASYFERVCLTEIPSYCNDRAWVFDRVPGSLLEGFDDKVLRGILSRGECEDACLREKSFLCRSAEYTSSIAECRLSQEDRRTRPDAFGARNEAVDYLENQCISLGRDCQSERKQDAFPTYIDAVRSNVSSEEECNNHCKINAHFNCRAYGYRQISSECLLSSVDKTAGGLDSILPRPETIYVSRVCRVMAENIVELTTNRPVITFSPINPNTKPPEITVWGSHSGRCQKGGTQIYEKTPGFAIAFEDISASMFTAAVPGITAECRGRCDMDLSCTGFTQDYNKLTCQFHSVDVYNDAARQRLIHAPSSAYFEIACIKVVTGCDRLWAFDRYLNKGFLAFASEILLGVSKASCEEACLVEKKFLCRAMTYNRFRGECRLYKDDRFMLPLAFVESAGTDYFENQCVGAGVPFMIGPRQGRTCDMVTHQGKFLQYAEENTSVASQKECDHLCSISSNFTCKSYSFLSEQKQCLLSSVTANEIGMKLMDAINAVYVELTCEQLQPIVDTTTVVSKGENCTAAGFSMERTIGVKPKIEHKNVLTSNSLIGKTKHCIQNCNRIKNNCMAFVQKLGTSCLSFDRSVARRDLVPSPGNVYFEKVCLRAIGCGKLWIFDRLIGFEFPSVEANRIHSGVETRQECQELCLQEGAFVCRSVIYDYTHKECRLHDITRYTNPFSFRDSNNHDIDYMENQCASDP